MMPDRCDPLRENRCQGRAHRSRCLPVSLELDDMAQFETIIRRRSPLKKGEPLIRQGSRFVGVYAVRSGSLKQVTTEGGDEQLTHFYLPSNWWGSTASTSRPIRGR